MCKATAPIDLLRELREVFVIDGANFRIVARDASTTGDQRAAGARAFACETAVKRIDATLRDWA
jgi:hypothetical protein